jgi:cytochrome c-type biogenesis protein CcmF
MGNVAEPATRHYWNKDIFTYVNYAEIEERDEGETKYNEPEAHSIAIGDTMYASNAIIILDGLEGENDPNKKAEKGLSPEDLLIAAKLRVYDMNASEHKVTSWFAAKGLQPLSFPAEISSAGLKISLASINPEEGILDFEVYESVNKSKEFIIMQAIVFPWINVLWAGSILMAIGTGMAVYARFKTRKA